MKKALTYTLTTIALIMTFSLAAYAGHHNVPRPDITDAADTGVTLAAKGHDAARSDGHLS